MKTKQWVLCGAVCALASCGVSIDEIRDRIVQNGVDSALDTPEAKQAKLVADALVLQTKMNARSKAGPKKVQAATGTAAFKGYALVQVASGATTSKSRLIGDADISVKFDGTRTLTGSVSNFVQGDLVSGIDPLDGSVSLTSSDINTNKNVSGKESFFTMDYNLTLAGTNDTYVSTGSIESMFKGNPFNGVGESKYIDNIDQATIANTGTHNGETVTFDVGVFAESKNP